MNQSCGNTLNHTATLSPSHSGVSHLIRCISSHLARGIVTIAKPIVQIVHNRTVELYQNYIRPAGLNHAPAGYIQRKFAHDIDHDVLVFLFDHTILEVVTHLLGHHEIPLAGHPRLTDASISSEGAARYLFDFSVAAKIELREWKHFLFRTPRRKNYKDLDKQVELFLKRTHERSRKGARETLEENDWVLFDAQLTDGNEPILTGHRYQLWAKIRNDNVSHPFYKKFIDRAVGDTLTTDHLPLHDNADPSIADRHHFLITIRAIVKGDFFSVDLFKTHFRLTSKNEIHEKLIEVFSYRNELSQRRTIIEEMFHLMLSKHRFEVPKHLVLRKQEELLNAVKQRPDYHAYRSASNFMTHIALLAEQQLKEEILIDQIARNEKITIEARDVQQYLNLISDARLREFLYFRLTSDIEDSSIPLHHCTLAQVCRREKTLNYILHHLTK